MSSSANTLAESPLRAAELFALDGRVALITGAGSGLGRRFARVLAANGARIAATDADRAAAAATAATVEATGAATAALALDVTRPDSIAAALDAAESRLGPVDLLVNNAGVLGMGRAIDLTEAAWRRVMDVDLDGVFRVSQAVARRLVKADRPGVIVNIASVLGVGTGKGVLPYTVAKGAVVHMTKALALELAPAGIRVNAIAPGYFETALTGDFARSKSGANLKRRIPQRRFGAEGDLDGALLLLASEASRFMTGVTIVVDGGQLLVS